jgi:hypothetical protein
MTPLEVALLRACNRADRRHTVTTALCYAILAAALALALTGCGDPASQAPASDRWVDGVGIRVDPGAPSWTSDDSATLDALRLGAEHAGGTLDDVRGWVIVFRAADVSSVDCAAPDHRGAYEGCAHQRDRWIDLVTRNTTDVYQTAAIHEAGHVVADDPCHLDAFWRNFSDVIKLIPAGEVSTDLTISEDGATSPVLMNWATKPTC